MWAGGFQGCGLRHSAVGVPFLVAAERVPRVGQADVPSAFDRWFGELCGANLQGAAASATVRL
jgi:hypothetical protein